MKNQALVASIVIHINVTTSSCDNNKSKPRILMKFKQTITKRIVKKKSVHLSL